MSRVSAQVVRVPDTGKSFCYIQFLQTGQSEKDLPSTQEMWARLADFVANSGTDVALLMMGIEGSETTIYSSASSDLIAHLNTSGEFFRKLKHAVAMFRKSDMSGWIVLERVAKVKGCTLHGSWNLGEVLLFMRELGFGNREMVTAALEGQVEPDASFTLEYA